MSNVDYKGSVTLISGLTQANNGSFPLVDGDAVQYKQEINEDGTFKSVSQKLSEFNRFYEYATSDDIDGILNGLFGQWKRLSLTEDTMLENTFEDQLKILSVNGNSYQPTSNNVVPTPEKSIPIISKKTNIKRISPNIFDLEKESDTSKITDSGTYRSVGQHQLKPNTKYVFSWSGATVPAKATLSFQIQDDKGTVLVSPFTYFNLESDEKEEAGKEVEFTTDSSGIIKFAYNCIVGTSSTTETYQQYWYTKILKDISLKEDVEYATEYVELRSLKETINKFDLGLLSQTDLISDNGAYRKIEIPIKLKPNTRYKIYYENSMIPALTWVVLNIVDNAEEVLVQILNVANTENSEVEKQAINLAFTSPNDGEIYFSYSVQSYNTEGVLVPQTTETFKEKWFTKILKNIMVTEETLNQTTYVAPTVRDYKIVDHVNKTSKIVRNTFELLLTGAENWQLRNSFGDLSQYFYLSTQYVSDTSNDTKNTHFKIGDPYSLNEDCLGFFVRDVRIRYDKYNENIEGLKQWLSENNVRVFGKLQTPTEEEIAYSADDVSEIGYSWQDTTSPSPTIKSEVKGVEEIDILKTGKNLFDINDEDLYLLEQITHSDNVINKNHMSIKPSIKLKNLIIGKEYTVSYSTKLSIPINNQMLLCCISTIKNEDYPNGRVIYKTGAGKTDYNVEIKFTATQSEMYLIFSIRTETITNLQLEQGDTATAYEPYKPPQFLSYQLATPLKGINNTKDIIDIESNQRTDNLTIFVLDDKTTKSIIVGTTKEKTQVFQLDISDIFNDNDIWCDKLKNNRNEDEELFTCQSGNLYIAIYKGRLETVDVAGFKKWLKDNPLTFTGSATTPTQEILPEDLPAKLNKLKTNDGSTVIYINSEVKPSLNIEYKGT